MGEAPVILDTTLVTQSVDEFGANKASNRCFYKSCHPTQSPLCPTGILLRLHILSKWQLFVYDWSGRNEKKWINKQLRRMGEAPVILDNPSNNYEPGKEC